MHESLKSYFRKNSIYTLKRNANVGFNHLEEIKRGRNLRYEELKYSHYDGCFAYYFKDTENIEKIEIWIHEDTPVEELDDTFEETNERLA